jgi:hypothetical protein
VGGQRGMCGGKVARTFVWMEKIPFLGGIKGGGNWPNPIQFQFDHRNGRID